MADTLADETLSDILARHLSIPDEDFESSGPYKRHLHASWRSSSNALLVSKRWLRVATPLLYNIVVLRSSAQVEGLCAALKTDKTLGAFVRKLRLEGGYGAVVHKIIAASPNITHLVLNIQLWSDDSSSGICKALPTMTITSLTLVAFSHSWKGPKANASMRKLQDTLTACIPKWQTLTRVVVTNDLPFHTKEGTPYLGASIAKVPHLRELHLKGFHLSNQTLRAYAGAASLERVFLYPWSTYAQIAKLVEEMALTDPGLARRLVPVQVPSILDLLLPFDDDSASEFTSRKRPITISQADPDFVPLRTCSLEVRERIWARVFSFVLQREALTLSDEFDDAFLWESRRLSRIMTLMLVSKEFLAIAQKVSCSSVHLRRHGHLVQFSRMLERRPELMGDLHSLRISFAVTDRSLPRNEFIIDDDDIGNGLSMLETLLHGSCLRSFDTSSKITSTHWAALVSASSGTLTTLRASGHERIRPDTTLSIFTALQNLEELSWNICDESNPHVTSKARAKYPDYETALPNLRKLDLSTFAASFLEHLCSMSLPSLKEVVFGDDERKTWSREVHRFLSRHGSKLTTVTLNWVTVVYLLQLCPNLTRLNLNRPGEKFLDYPHAKLEMIYIKKSYTFPDDEQWEKFADSFNVADYPALREISIEVKHLQWPTDERSVAKSHWTKIGEKLLEHNVALVDRVAGPWRPRLKKPIRARKSRKTDTSEQA
ncbi:hypothetical protein EXIGLDRAFT_70300 [Exidia glandulosa HHB12029]|uniref:Uncharacterized protein n=1 Tax=Exidia glandulosa HHB12029 TaxID=1314781 RepID=A0A165HZS9_EXIGL|nr:hypothetical protein EXIGLDRAFT_70300 [Exidia glandulosa HHB12029]